MAGGTAGGRPMFIVTWTLLTRTFGLKWSPMNKNVR